MRLINGDKWNFELLRKRAEAVGQQPFGRNIEQLICTIVRVAVRLAQFIQTHGTVDAPGRDPRVPQRHDLILHQRDQRRDDKRYPRQQQRGQFITEAFSAARRHNAKRVASGKNGVDQRLLARTEFGKSEILPQRCKLVHTSASPSPFFYIISVPAAIDKSGSVPTRLPIEAIVKGNVGASAR